MDLTYKTMRFSQPLLLVMLIAICASANAGDKIFKTIDSQGNVTFTDVPHLLEPQLPQSQTTRDGHGRATMRPTTRSEQPPNRICEAAESPPKQSCRHTAD